MWMDGRTDKRRKNGQTNRQNYTNFERNLAMIVIYLPVKFEFDWTKCFRVRVRKRKMWTDVGHINLIGGLVTRNPPKNLTTDYFSVGVLYWHSSLKLLYFGLMYVCWVDTNCRLYTFCGELLLECCIVWIYREWIFYILDNDHIFEQTSEWDNIFQKGEYRHWTAAYWISHHLGANSQVVQNSCIYSVSGHHMDQWVDCWARLINFLSDWFHYLIMV